MNQIFFNITIVIMLTINFMLMFRVYYRRRGLEYIKELIKNIFKKFRKEFKVLKKYFGKIIKFLIIMYLLLAFFYSVYKENIKLFLNFVGVQNEISLKILEFYARCLRIGTYFLCAYIVIILLFYVLKVLYKIIGNIVQKMKFKSMLKNGSESETEKELFKALYEYFLDKSNTPIFITGNWGAGKTYFMNKFLGLYHKFSNQKVYQISCFGITTKENLMDSIKNCCEKNDTSFLVKILEIIVNIPIIGEFLKKLFEKDYDLNSIEEGSIFIFDNFERIETLNKVCNSISNENYTNILSKYNIVSGVIDELIEKYNMKVVIIGNENEMIENYADNIFIKKIGCKRYTIIPKGELVREFWNEKMELGIYPKKYLDYINYNFNNFSDNVCTFYGLLKGENNRMVKRTIDIFLDFMYYYYEKNDFRLDSFDMETIFYNIFLRNVPGDDDREILQLLNNYDNIGLIMGIIGKKDERFLELSDIEAMWIRDNEFEEALNKIEANKKEIYDIYMDRKSQLDIKCISPINWRYKNISEIEIPFEKALYIGMEADGFDFYLGNMFRDDRITKPNIKIIDEYLDINELVQYIGGNIQLKEAFFDWCDGKLRKNSGFTGAEYILKLENRIKNEDI